MVDLLICTQQSSFLKVEKFHYNLPMSVQWAQILHQVEIFHEIQGAKFVNSWRNDGTMGLNFIIKLHVLSYERYIFMIK